MNKWLEKLEDGGDARVIILEMSSEIKKRDEAMDTIFNLVADVHDDGKSIIELAVDITSAIPSQCLKNQTH